MLEKDRPPTQEVVKHIDRCLSCLACMTTCPSGVNYMHLVDQAGTDRKGICPAADRTAVARGAGLCAAAARMVSRRHDHGALRPAVRGPAAGIRRLGFTTLLRRIKAMLALAPNNLPKPGPSGGSVFPALGERRGRVALLQGCAQQVLAPRINQAAINVLTRHGIEVVLVRDEQCWRRADASSRHDGDALARARANIKVWLGEAEQGGLDAILVTTSGCGTVIKTTVSAARGPRIRSSRREDFHAGKGYHRVSRRHRSQAIRGKTAIWSSPIIRLFVAARTENHASSERIAFPRTDSW